jgi:hypothetical protein
MGYRRPTRQPGHELAESERKIDDHLAAAGQRREKRVQGLRRLDRSLLVGRWLIAIAALAIGTAGVFAESQQRRLQALCLFAVVLLWWALRLLARIFR